MTIREGLAALCVVGALVACSEEAAAPPPLPSAATSSPTPVALPVPPEATPETPQGAAAFARYYLGLVNQAFERMDATAVKAVSDPECGGCQNLIEAIERPPIAGERVEGGEFKVVFAESPPIENGDVIVDVRYVLTEVRVLGPDGSLLRQTPEKPATDAQMRLIRGGSAGWTVKGFRSVE